MKKFFNISYIDNQVLSKSKEKKFLRRSDLSIYERLYIATKAIFNNNWGTITRLSQDYMISRTFIYMLKKDLQKVMPLIFRTIEKTKDNIKKKTFN